MQVINTKISHKYMKHIQQLGNLSGIGAILHAMTADENPLNSHANRLTVGFCRHDRRWTIILPVLVIVVYQSSSHPAPLQRRRCNARFNISRLQRRPIKAVLLKPHSNFEREGGFWLNENVGLDLRVIRTIVVNNGAVTNLVFT
jgi:hypothetical protein